MSVFRPSARVTSPDGRAWEIYAYKIKVGERPWDAGLDAPRSGYSRFDALASLADGVFWVVSLIPLLFLRLWDVSVAAARAARSDEWTIEAVSFLPAPERFTWTTTREFRGQVLAQVEGSLARGDIPQHLTNATYLGQGRLGN